ncbi:hypothetical protein Q0Z83_062250 [Actinoplanes sichuanensis]|uniref:DUF1877 family protein n=1 Tax=Actinoplanes sichuanensis TaxID=512349 RepID=A0ABW4A082_9ACTN|nr:hypothetical protein [Actinoplanes sichuanensis]BEL08034.1 hypothetical protein Q0Z83_062250 [Actinoplanes sichuanensis]
MGVMYDYFRGPDAATVTDLMDRTDADPPGTIEEWVTEVVDVKWLDAAVCVGALCAFIAGVGRAAGSSGIRLVWPVLDPEDLMEHQGPWVEQLTDEMRDTLAGVDDGRIPELAARWVRIEEIYRPGAADDELVPVVTDLVALARAARAGGEHLYCWVCL